MIKLLTLGLLLTAPVAQVSNVDFVFDKNLQLLTTLETVILKDDDLTTGKIYDYMSVVMELSDEGLKELESLEENTLSEELQMKEYSLGIVELLLLKQSEK